MNTNKNFFDNIDGDWEDVIANIYEGSNVPIFSFDMVNEYNFIWRPVILKSKNVLMFELPNTKRNYTLEEAELFHYSNVKLINKDYKVDLYLSKQSRPNIEYDCFTIYTCMNDVIMYSEKYNKQRNFSDIIKEYIGDEGVDYLNNCGGFKVGYDNFVDKNSNVFNSFEEFLNNEELLEIYSFRYFSNMIFHYMGNYEVNLLRDNDNTKKTIEELRKTANKL